HRSSVFSGAMALLFAACGGTGEISAPLDNEFAPGNSSDGAGTPGGATTPGGTPGLPPDNPPGGNTPPGTNVPPVQVGDPTYLDDPRALGLTELRALTSTEMLWSLEDAFQLDLNDLGTFLPEDVIEEEYSPFDNRAELQSISFGLVNGIEAFAYAVADRVVSSGLPQVHAIAGCSPTGNVTADSGCFVQHVEQLGRLLWRRAPDPATVDSFSELYAIAVDDSDFGAALRYLVAGMIQSPSFFFRAEFGTNDPVDPDLLELDNYSVASRLSFLFWGTGPDHALLAAAESGELLDPISRAQHAARLFNDPRAERHWQRYHALWLGYETVPLPTDLENDMRGETQALVRRIVFEENLPWSAFFEMDESFVTPGLAEHYDMPVPSQPDWVPYDHRRGGGVLSHATFLAQGAKFNDTSPTVRGYRVAKRMLCQVFDTIPPSIDTDNPPGAGTGGCKEERYTMRDSAACQSCHIVTDGIGFGLENFDAYGAYRDVETADPSCAVRGEGSFDGQDYAGAAELGALFAGSDDVGYCATTQLYRFLTGKIEGPSDRKALDALFAQYRDTPTLRGLLFDLIDRPSFTHRVRD
ncbi:MAG: DUF1592 domain-containing protein, partial [Myxococcota bacterium]